MQLTRLWIAGIAMATLWIAAGCDQGVPKSDTGTAAKGDQSSSSAEASTAAQPNRGAIEHPGKGEGE